MATQQGVAGMVPKETELTLREATAARHKPFGADDGIDRAMLVSYTNG